MDNPTRSIPNSHFFVLDLELISPSLHNDIKYYVHLDPFVSGYHPTCMFLKNSLHITVRVNLVLLKLAESRCLIN